MALIIKLETFYAMQTKLMGFYYVCEITSWRSLDGIYTVSKFLPTSKIVITIVVRIAIEVLILCVGL